MACYKNRFTLLFFFFSYSQFVKFVQLSRVSKHCDMSVYRLSKLAQTVTIGIIKMHNR
jgi:hypothetical protein